MSYFRWYLLFVNTYLKIPVTFILKYIKSIHYFTRKLKRKLIKHYRFGKIRVSVILLFVIIQNGYPISNDQEPNLETCRRYVPPGLVPVYKTLVWCPSILTSTITLVTTYLIIPYSKDELT